MGMWASFISSKSDKDTRLEQKRGCTGGLVYLEMTGNGLHGMTSLRQRVMGWCVGCVSWSNLGVWGNIFLGGKGKCA